MNGPGTVIFTCFVVFAFKHGENQLHVHRMILGDQHAQGRPRAVCRGRRGLGLGVGAPARVAELGAVDGHQRLEVDVEAAVVDQAIERGRRDAERLVTILPRRGASDAT